MIVGFLMCMTRQNVQNLLQHVCVFIIFVWIVQMIGLIMKPISLL